MKGLSVKDLRGFLVFFHGYVMPFGVNNADLNDDKYLIAHVTIFYPHPKSSHKMRVGLSFVYTGLYLGIL
jgi:hypothetical protein